MQVQSSSQGHPAWHPVSRCQFQGSSSLSPAVSVLTRPGSSTPCAVHSSCEGPQLCGPWGGAQAALRPQVVQVIILPRPGPVGSPCPGFPRQCCGVRGFWVHVRRSAPFPRAGSHDPVTFHPSTSRWAVCREGARFCWPLLTPLLAAPPGALVSLFLNPHWLLLKHLMVF